MSLPARRRSARHRCRAVLLLAVTLLLGAVEGRAAHLFFRTLDDDDGLATPDVRSLAQDARGFLWIGTMGGLYRYDGVEMRSWAPEALRLPLDALHNAARHAEASHVRLALVPDDGAWRLAVADDGVGIPPGADSGMGLENMRRRAGEIGGRLELRDRNPKGTVVSLRFRIRDPRGR